MRFGYISVIFLRLTFKMTGPKLPKGCLKAGWERVIFDLNNLYTKKGGVHGKEIR